MNEATETLNCRGVYGFFDDGQLLYVGESKNNIETVEYNNRNYLELFAFDESTLFRQQLRLYHQNSGTFYWMIPPDYRSVEDSQAMLQNMIVYFSPRYNIRYDALDNSVALISHNLPSDR